MAEEEPQAERRKKRALVLVAVVAGGAVAFVALDRRRRQAAGDLGRQLVELFGQVGDLLSEYQDAVAGEAYLGTGPRRGDVYVLFGDGAIGARPAADRKLLATYRTGQGVSGRRPA